MDYAQQLLWVRSGSFTRHLIGLQVFQLMRVYTHLAGHEVVKQGLEQSI